MNRIYLSPGDVRGLGNIISPHKTLEDYTKFYCDLEEVEDTMSGVTVTAYEMSYHNTPGVITSITLTTNKTEVVVGETATLTAIVKYDTGMPVPNQEVTFMDVVGETVTATTNNQGVATVPFKCDEYGSIDYYEPFCFIEEPDVSSENIRVTVTGAELSFNDVDIWDNLNRIVTCYANTNYFIKGKLVSVCTDTVDYSVCNVKAYMDNTLINTVSVGSDGKFSIPFSFGSVGEHTIRLTVDDVDLWIGTSTSLTKNVVAPRVLSSITASANKSTLNLGESLTITLYCYDQDGLGLPGQSVNLVNDSGDVVGSGSTGSNGGTSIVFTPVSVGGQFVVVTSGSVSSNQVGFVVNQVFDGYTFVERTGKSILSYKDGDEAVLDVQLTNEGSPVSVEGVSVEFYQDNVLVDTVDTDSTGLATYEYTSQGVGDTTFSIKINSISLIQTYGIQDCLLYTENTITPTASYSSYLSRMLSNFSFDGSIDYEVEVDFKLSGGGGGFSIAPINNPTYTRQIAFGYNNDQISAYWGNNTATNESSQRHNKTPTWNTWHHWKITKIGSDFNWDRDNGADTFSTTASWLGTYGQMGLFFYKWENPSMNVKNIKIKPL